MRAGGAPPLCYRLAQPEQPAVSAKKGRDGGSGAYRGARWHGADEVRTLFAGLPVRKLRLRSAISLPSANGWARRLETVVSSALPWGGLLLATGEKA